MGTIIAFFLAFSTFSILPTSTKIAPVSNYDTSINTTNDVVQDDYMGNVVQDDYMGNVVQDDYMGN